MITAALCEFNDFVADCEQRSNLNELLDWVSYYSCEIHDRGGFFEVEMLATYEGIGWIDCNFHVDKNRANDEQYVQELVDIALLVVGDRASLMPQEKQS